MPPPPPPPPESRVLRASDLAVTLGDFCAALLPPALVFTFAASAAAEPDAAAAAGLRGKVEV